MKTCEEKILIDLIEEYQENSLKKHPVLGVIMDSPNSHAEKVLKKIHRFLKKHNIRNWTETAAKFGFIYCQKFYQQYETETALEKYNRYRNKFKQI